MKKFVILALFLTNMFSADTVRVSVEEAVQINTKLIKYLYDENESLKKEIEAIKNTLYSQKEKQEYSKNIWLSAANSSKSAKKMIASKQLNVRKTPKIDTNNIIGSTSSPSIVNCVSVQNGWCYSDNYNGFIWISNLQDYREKIYKTLENAKMRVSPFERESNVITTFEKGKEITTVFHFNDWYMLDNGSFIKDKDLQ